MTDMLIAVGSGILGLAVSYGAIRQRLKTIENEQDRLIKEVEEQRQIKTQIAVIESKLDFLINNINKTKQ